MRNKLQAEFKSVKTVFFPRWDRAHEWKCRKVSVDRIQGACGMCKADQKTIQIAGTLGHGSLTLLLIHEICHAVSGCTHGTPWTRRMEKAAKRADEIGRTGLAKEIRREVASYQESPMRGTAAEIYGAIGDALLDCPQATLLHVADSIRHDYPWTRAELFSLYPRFRKVYEQEKRRA